MNPNLIHCTKCGHIVAKKAPACPGCGAPPYTKPKRRYWRWWAVGINLAGLAAWGATIPDNYRETECHKELLANIRAHDRLHPEDALLKDGAAIPDESGLLTLVYPHNNDVDKHRHQANLPISLAPDPALDSNYVLLPLYTTCSAADDAWTSTHHVVDRNPTGQSSVQENAPTPVAARNVSVIPNRIYFKPEKTYYCHDLLIMRKLDAALAANDTATVQSFAPDDSAPISVQENAPCSYADAGIGPTIYSSLMGRSDDGVYVHYMPYLGNPESGYSSESDDDGYWTDASHLTDIPNHLTD